MPEKKTLGIRWENTLGNFDVVQAQRLGKKVSQALQKTLNWGIIYWAAVK